MKMSNAGNCHLRTTWTETQKANSDCNKLAVWGNGSSEEKQSVQGAVCYKNA